MAKWSKQWIKKERNKFFQNEILGLKDQLTTTILIITMKLDLEHNSAIYQIQRVDSQNVTINHQVYARSIILMPESLTDWAVESFDTLEVTHFQQLAALHPELVLLGTGLQIRFPASALLVPLLEQRIGIEVMDTRAACRTYTILVAEGRTVAAALLFK